MLNCYIVDDEIASIEIISDYIHQTKGIQLLGSSTRPHDIIDMMSGAVKPDITFLDIDMPGINGLELAGIINQYTSVIFITSYPQYGAEAFEKDAFDFLTKPVSYARFMQSIVKVKNRLKVVQPASGVPLNNYFFIRGNLKGQYVKIQFDDLLYVEALQNFVKLYTAKGTFICYLTLKELEFKLCQQNFTRTHKSYIINIDKIQSMDGNQIIMADQKTVVLGPAFRSKFIDLLKEKLIVSDRSHSNRL